MQKLNCFKAYDIRGVLGEELNSDIAYRIGRAYGELFKPRLIVVGGDARLTSDELKLSLARGLQDSGTNILDIGLSGTEEIYFATSFLNANGGIEITASHNPINYNGMKLVRENSQPISGETGLNKVRELAEINDFPNVNTEEIGKYERIDLKEDYIRKILSFVNLNNFNKKIKVVVNSGNGAAGKVIDKLDYFFQKNSIPISIIKINNEPDGTFPRGIPNPLLPECRKDTSDAVIKHGANLGVAFDGDFDRCFIFDENGCFIEGYYIVGLLAEVFLTKKPREKIIHDPRLTWNTIDIVNKNGGIPIISKTGHAFIKEKMREENAIYGGEMSAHHYFRDFYYCDSGMIPWLMIVELINIRNKNISDLVNYMENRFPTSGEINIKLDNPHNSIQKVYEKYKSECIAENIIDGISMEFTDWRFNLRISNTESLVRLNVESKNEESLMKEKRDEILSLLNMNELINL